MNDGFSVKILSVDLKTVTNSIIKSDLIIQPFVQTLDNLTQV